MPAVRLELLPKSTIDIFLTVIENDGIEGCIAAGSVAASAALAHAGIEMLGLVVACSAVCRCPAGQSLELKSFQCAVGNEIWLDPTDQEAQAASGSLIVAGMPALETITNVWQSGRMSPMAIIQVSVFVEHRLLHTHPLLRGWRHAKSD